MSRDLTEDERQKFIGMYGAGATCQRCGTPDVVVKIWEKHGTNAAEIGGDITGQGIIGAIVACDGCGNAQTVARSEILAVG